MRLRGILVLTLLAAAPAAAQRPGYDQQDYERLEKARKQLVAENDDCCNDFYRKQQENIAEWRRRHKAGEYTDRAAADQDWQRMETNLRQWKNEQDADYNARLAAYNEASRTGNADLVDVHPGYLIKYPFAGARPRGPSLARADAETLGKQLRARDPSRVRAALGVAETRGVKLPADDLALLLMRSRDEDQVVRVAHQLLRSDPRGGPAVLARHVMQGRPGTARIRPLLGDDATRRVSRARQVEPQRAALIQKAQAVTADDPEGLAALDRLAQVPGGDVGALLERLAGDKSTVVAGRAQAALAKRPGR